MHTGWSVDSVAGFYLSCTVYPGLPPDKPLVLMMSPLVSDVCICGKSQGFFFGAESA